MTRRSPRELEDVLGRVVDGQDPDRDPDVEAAFQRAKELTDRVYAGEPVVDEAVEAIEDLRDEHRDLRRF